MVFAHRHHDLLLFRCDAAMLHSLNSGRATSDWTASGRSLVKSKQASMAAIDWVFVLCFFFLGMPFLVMSMSDQETLSADPDVRPPPHIQPATDEQEQTKEIRARTKSQTQTGPSPRHAPVARSCKRGIARPTLPSSSSTTYHHRSHRPSSASHLQSSTCLPEYGPG